MVPADPLSPLRHFPQPYRTFSRFPADPSTGPLALSNAVAIIYRPVGFRSSPLRRLSACLAVSNAVDNSAGRAGLSFSLPRPSPTLLRVPLDPSASRFHLAHIRFISAPSGTLPRLRSDLLLHSQTLLVPSTRLNAPCRKRRSLCKETRTCVCIRPRPPARRTATCAALVLDRGGCTHRLRSARPTQTARQDVREYIYTPRPPV